MKGCFIVFEGIDGSGKTEQVKQLAKKLINMKYDIVVTREPTKNSSIGRLIHKILYEKVEVTEESLALLFAADRIDHTKLKIIPELEKGKVVLSDRYVYSSIAYQSVGMNVNIDTDWIRKINKFSIEPDIVIFLDISVESARIRINESQKRVQDKKIFENLKKQELIRSKYYEIFGFNSKYNNTEKNIKKYKNNAFQIYTLNNMIILKVNATLPIKTIKEEIGKYVKKYLERKNVQKIIKKQIIERKIVSYLEESIKIS